MASTASHYLAINAGSSSIKFALYRAEPALHLVFAGSIDGIGGKQACLRVQGDPADTVTRHFPIPERVTAVNVLLDWLGERIAPGSLRAVAHRIVHGAAHSSTREIDAALLGQLHDAVRDEPEHLPQEVHLIETLRRRFPDATHVACFDSSFHACMPAAASTLAIPHRFSAAGVRRHGYHGLSCAWMMRELARLDGPDAANGKLILAHLGGGASVTAVEHGASCDTTMGLTPAGGIPMGTRSGDIDPGLARHCMRQEPMSEAQFHHMLNHESGLLGVSGRSADLQVLLKNQGLETGCADAVELFVYQTRKAICAMAGALDGVATLVFAGGVGEHSAEVRARICARLHHLGIVLDPDHNNAHRPVISGGQSQVLVRVMRTDEQWMLAEEARLLLAAPHQGSTA
ncbi:acetate/propionate family kinase [Massilia sp. TWP1-3-3]|uniref:acetate/propionate family kinase n=1 Tax=Massilia sp. TWP1-3-3 TaxID=2804573 RepID=UPI003CF8D275